MSMFIGLRMDEESTEEISQWLKRCARKDPTFHALPKQFIYIPVCYTGAKDLEEDFLRSQVMGQINEPIKLARPRIDFLGYSGNVSLIFDSEWIKSRYKFWIKQDRRFRQRSDGRHTKFKARIPMSHHSHYLNEGWLRDLPIREIRLIEEFSTPFDRRQFLSDVKAAMGWET